MRSKAIISTVVLALATCLAHAQTLEIGRNALPLGEHTTAVVRASIAPTGGSPLVVAAESESFSLERFVWTYDRMGWERFATTAASGAGSFYVDSLDLGTGSFLVRGVTPAGPSPAFNVAVKSSPCDGDFMLNVVSASGPGVIAAGESAAWTITYAFTPCRDLTRVALRIGGTAINLLESPADAAYSYSGKPLKNAINLGSLAGRVASKFTIRIVATAPMTTQRRFEIAPRWTVEYENGRNRQTVSVHETTQVEQR